MDASNPMTPQNQQKREDSRRKRKAILAGGVVLGLGAAVTLAAWSDDVWADGLFTTGGTFLIEGSEDAIGGGQNFETAQEVGQAIRLTFSATALTPGDTAYAPFAIQTTDTTTLEGAIERVTAAAEGPMADALEYSITKDATSCDANGANGPTWVTDEPVTGAQATGGPLALQPASGNTVQLCVAVNFPNTPEAKNAVDSATVTQSTSVTWDFFAEQKD